MINYAPIIDTNIPGFFTRNDNKNIQKLRINFKHNIAVSKNDVKGIRVIIKPYSQKEQTQIIAYRSATVLGNSDEYSHYDLDAGQVTIYSAELKKQDNYFQPGMYYKVQIAYIDLNNTIGPYSSVGVVKCLGGKGNTGISIENLIYEDAENKKVLNEAQNSYLGKFIGPTETAEEIYQYRFYFKEKSTGKMIKDTGWMTPTYNDSNEPIMTFSVEQELDRDKEYYLGFGVTTINGYNQVLEYRISGKKQEYPNRYTENIEVFQDEEAIENGYVIIQLYSPSGARYSKTEIGTFRLLRKELGQNIWEHVVDFSLNQKSDLEKFIWKDFSVECGKKYLYAVQEYYQDLATGVYYYSDKQMADNIVIPEFDCMFLSDKDHQLRIAFNPQVSSLKNVVQENKVDMLGNKYPYFSRNGHIDYKELSISGLISYHMDPQHFFLSCNEKGLADITFQRKNTPSLNPVSSDGALSIKNLFLNQYNQDQKHYIGIFNETKTTGNIIQYYYKFYDKDKPSTILDSVFGIPDRDINNVPIFNFDLNYNMKNDKIYRLWLKVETDLNKTYEITYSICKNITMPSLELTNDNFSIEKDFKLEVLNWLNNGQPKLFRSPAEGNYILRLMNVSLSPNTVVGRMLHTFSATGYEIADNTLKNIKEMSLTKYDKQTSSELWDLSSENRKKVMKTYYIRNEKTAGARAFASIPIYNSTNTLHFYNNLKQANKKSFDMFLKNRPEYAALGTRSCIWPIHVYLNNQYEAYLGPLSNMVRIATGQEFILARLTALQLDIDLDKTVLASVLQILQNYPEDGNVDNSDLFKVNTNNWIAFKNYLSLNNSEKVNGFCTAYGLSNDIKEENGITIFSANRTNWFSLWHKGDIEFTKGCSLLFPLRDNTNSFQGKIKITNAKIDEDRENKINNYANICRYSKVKTITLEADQDLQDPWAKDLYDYQDRNNKDTIKTIKILQKLFDIGSVEGINDNDNPKLTVYFKDGTYQTYAQFPEKTQLSLNELKNLKENTQIMKIIPSLNTKVDITGLFSYATPARLGYFHLNNSRLGDEYL